MTLDQLYESAADCGIEIDDVPMRELRAVSFPQGWIAIDRRKFSSDTDYKCALAHEIGHCETGSFYNIHSSTHEKELAERQASRFAAELLVPLPKLKHAIINLGVAVNRTLALMFDVTLDFINLVLELFEQELLAAARTRPLRPVPIAFAYNYVQSFSPAGAKLRSD